MMFLEKRVRVICNQLNKLSIKQKQTIDGWVYKKGKFIYPKEANDAADEFKPFDRTMHWYGPDAHYWFKTEFIVPQEFDRKPLWINVKTQIEEWDDAKNPQFLLFVNGEIIQGIDMNHREVLLDKAAIAGKKLVIELQAYTGTLHSEFKLIVEAMEVDAEIESLYYDLVVPLNAFDRLEKDGKPRLKLECILNNAVNLIDFRTPYSSDFYESLSNSKKYLEVALYTDFVGYDDVIATCIGHTHIDVAWWWTVEQTKEKVSRSFATVLKLMDEFPNYKFMSSQPLLYSFLKKRYPKLYDKVKKRIEENRWEVEGGMWVEADTNVPSGESLIRQFLYGKRFFKNEFNSENRILWLPDVFGYSGALPQIMAKCGIDYFMTTKLSWNQLNKIPNDTFLWRGIDGTEILTHFITTLDVGQDEENFFTTYNGRLHPDAIIGAWKRYQNKELSNDILISYGYGDGGGGPTREMLETSKRMEKGILGIPKVRQGFARTYFDELQSKISGNPKLKVWEGELYFEYHRGTLTSMARNKRSNRKCEFLLMDLELISVLTGKRISPDDFEEAWKILLRNQFHDILPGTSIHEVYEVTKKEYEKLQKRMNKHTRALLESLICNKKNTLTANPSITVVNTTGFVRDDIVDLGEFEGQMLKDTNGIRYPVQQTSQGAITYIKGLPAKGWSVFEVTLESSQNKPIVLHNKNCLETPFYKVAFDEFGFITELYDKEVGRDVIQNGKQANMFKMYEDKPIYYDNWDIDAFYVEKSWPVTELTHFKWTDIGCVVAILTQERVISNSKITQNIKFYAESRRIDFETKIDWNDSQHLLKVHFPVNIHTDEATFDIQFGNITRKTHFNTSWDIARFETCGQKWIDLSEGHYGVSLLNDCKYGHSVENSNIALTLIKSGIEPNPLTDQESHEFTYSLLAHNDGWRKGGTVKQGYFLNQQAYVLSQAAVRNIFSLVSSSAENVVVETVKPAEDGGGVILRIYECDNSLTDVTLTYGRPIKSVFECNMLEENLFELEFAYNNIPVQLKPYEIKTIRIR